MARQILHQEDNNNQSTTNEDPPIFGGPELETSISRHFDLNLNLPSRSSTYNPYLLMQQLETQSYSSYSIVDLQDHYDQQAYRPQNTHQTNLYTMPQDIRYRHQENHPPLQEHVQGYIELQQMQPDDFVQSSYDTFDTQHVGPMQRMLPRRLPHVRQRIRRRNRTYRRHISHVHSNIGDVRRNNRENSTATSVTGSETSGSITQTIIEIEGSQERLSRLTSAAVTTIEESSSIGENFECNICFQKANEAVVTCCGHLFCWPCLYRWLHIHSYHKECPVCKGAIAEYSITPIYGRENTLAISRTQGTLGSERIPPRPSARRIESQRQQRDREERERERHIREEEARERINQEHLRVTNFEQVAIEIEEEGEPRARGGGTPTYEPTSQVSENVLLETVELAQMSQDVEDINQLDREVDDHPSEQSQGGYSQQRLALRREQLRQALANSRYNTTTNQNLETRNNDRQQIMAATALLSQEWEHIITRSGLVVDSTQAEAWLASMHARLANIENDVEPNLDTAQQRRQMITSVVSQFSQPHEAINRFVVHPAQISDWIATMRTRLNNIEQLMHNFEYSNHMPSSIDNSNLGNPNPIQLADSDDINSNEFHLQLNATMQEEIAAQLDEPPNYVSVQDVGNQNDNRRNLFEGHVNRRSRRRREHGEETSREVAHDDAMEAPHEDQVPVIRKRRRRLD